VKSAPNPVVVPGSGYRLQLGALKTEDAAKAEFVRLQKAQPDVLGRLSLSISKVDLGGGKGMYYRIQAGPIANPEQATQGCATLKSRGVSCILVKP
jgi:cell division septation protein DedD